MIEWIQDQFGVFQGTYTYRIVLTAWDLFVTLWLPLLIGLALTATIMVSVSAETVRKLLSGNRWWAIITATLLGTMSPLCTYLAIPLVAILLRAGLPPGPLTAFLFSSPLMNPTLFSLTWGALGLPMAMARLVAAILIGLCAGFVVGELLRCGWFSFASIGDTQLERRLERHRTPGGPYWKRWLGSFLHLGWFTGKYFFLALILAAAVKELIPIEWVMSVLGRQHSYSIVLGMAMGVPLYACGGGTIPFIKVLSDMGMDPGACLAFFVSGPATKVPTLAAMSATLKGRFLTFYLILMLGAALVFGFIYSPLAWACGWGPAIGY